MDVTSMLNKFAVQVPNSQNRPTIDTKQVSNNRTPWDAGGYSLPVMSHTSSTSVILHTMNESTESKFPTPVSSTMFNGNAQMSDVNMAIDSTPQQQSFSDVSYMNNNTKEDYQPQDELLEIAKCRRDSAQSIRHQFSDSRSSLSSFASSLSLNNASHSHSRYSSTSTVSGYLPMGTITDVSDFDEKLKNGYDPSMQRSPTAYSPMTPHPRAHSVTSAIEPLSTLALIAERRSQEDSFAEAEDEKLKRHRFLTSASRAKSQLFEQNNRSASPSDGLLIKRPSLADIREPETLRDRRRKLLVSSTLQGFPSNTSNVVSSMHKRTTSAPSNGHMIDGGSTSSPDVSSTITAVLLPGPAPRSSDHPERRSSIAISFEPSLDTTSEHRVGQGIPEPKCMYIEDCDTNSTPRKAISHLLGRNKMCTRLIPAHIWVQYCRKHYQRARYRNMGGWPPLQCELVQEQIRRLETWSNENVAKASGPVVKDWTLALRKREQTRRDKLAKTASRQAGLIDGHDFSDAEADDISPTRGGSDNPPQAVPEWLFEMVGSGYSNAEISNIFERIHLAIIQKDLPNMPDIEILPNIIVDREAPKEAKGYVKRKPIAHQRSRSLGGAALRGSEVWNTSARQGSQPVWDPAPMYATNTMSPAVKRKRFDDLVEEPDYMQTMPNSQCVRVSQHDTPSRRAPPVPRAYGGWIETPQQMMQQQTQQAHQQQQQQQYQQQMQLLQQQQQHQQHQNQRGHLGQPHIDDLQLRHGQYPQSHTHTQAYSHHQQQPQSQSLYGSPMVAPQPTRQPYMSTAQQLDPDISSGATSRRTAIHQRARSEMAFLRRDDSSGFAMTFGHAAAQQQQQYGQQHPQQQQQQIQYQSQNTLPPRSEVRESGVVIGEMRQQHQQHQQHQHQHQQQFIDPSLNHSWGIPDTINFRR